LVLKLFNGNLLENVFFGIKVATGLNKILIVGRKMDFVAILKEKTLHWIDPL
jgi:hypothetical protein